MRTGRPLHGLAGDRLPGADRRDLAGGENLRRLVGLGINELQFLFLHAGALQAVQEQEVLDQTDLDDKGIAKNAPSCDLREARLHATAR